MKRCQVLAPLIIDDKRYRRGDVLTGAEAQAVADSPILQARCTQVADVAEPDHGATALPGAGSSTAYYDHGATALPGAAPAPNGMGGVGPKGDAK